MSGTEQLDWWERADWLSHGAMTWLLGTEPGSKFHRGLKNQAAKWFENPGDQAEPLSAKQMECLRSDYGRMVEANERREQWAREGGVRATFADEFDC